MSTVWPSAQGYSDPSGAAPAGAAYNPYPYAGQPQPVPPRLTVEPGTTLGMVATVVMIVGAIAGFVGVCLPYYSFQVKDPTGQIFSPGASVEIAGTGWLVTFTAVAGVVIAGGLGLALFTSGWFPKPKGADEHVWPRYLLLLAFGLPAVLAVASCRLYPTFTLPKEVQQDMQGVTYGFTMGLGFWLLLAGAVVGLAGAFASYLAWAAKYGESRPRAASVIVAPPMGVPMMAGPGGWVQAPAPQQASWVQQPVAPQAMAMPTVPITPVPAPAEAVEWVAQAAPDGPVPPPAAPEQ